MTVSYDFTGRTAVVTGASKGIGRRIAERLRDASAQVWNFDLSPIQLHGIRQLRVDVTDAGQIADAVAQLQEETSRLDILVNNAGFTGGSLTVEQLDPADWRRIIEVNLTGVFEVTRHVVPVMRQGGWGRIVNIARRKGRFAESPAKAGVIAFTKSLRKELADTNIRVYAVAPAAVETDILQQMAPEYVQAMIAKSPMKRLGTVDEVAEMVLWLCSRRARSARAQCSTLRVGGPLTEPSATSRLAARLGRERWVRSRARGVGLFNSFIDAGQKRSRHLKPKLFSGS